MADGDALIIGKLNNGVQVTQLQGDAGEFAVGLEVLAPGDATVSDSAAIIGRSADRRTGVLGIGSPGIVGRPSQPGQPGVVGHGDNSGVGVLGLSGQGIGVAGDSAGGYGVTGIAGKVGVYAQNNQQHTEAYLGTRGVAGDFYGGVSVHGFLTETGGGFQIDHPQYPADRYLFHSFVESSEMKNLYDGIAKADADGEAIIDLPEWFEALNKDFRYHLTSVGRPGPELYVAEEIAGNQFKIAGGKPHQRISWQVTGVRRDTWAEANQRPNEQDKPDEERGTFIHAEIYGEPSERGLSPHRYPDVPLRNRSRSGTNTVVQGPPPESSAGSTGPTERKTHAAEPLDLKQLADAASKIMEGLTSAALLWPAGVVSFIGVLVLGIAVWSEVWVGGRLNSTEYVATLVVGAVLTFVGPIIAGGQQAGAQGVVKKFMEENPVPSPNVNGVQSLVEEFERRKREVLGESADPSNGE